MDALLIALVAGLAAEIGARTQQHCFAAREMDSIALPIFAIFCVSLGVAAVGGMLVSPIMPPDARLLLLGMALFFAGIGQLRRIADVAAPASKTTAITKIGLMHLTEGMPFLVFALAARAGQPAMAALGGLLAVSVICFPTLVLGDEIYRPNVLRPIKRVAAAILVVSGLWAGLIGLRLI